MLPIFKDALLSIMRESKIDANVWNLKRRDKKYNINQLKIIKVSEQWVYYSLISNITSNFVIAVDYSPKYKLDNYFNVMMKYHKNFPDMVLLSYDDSLIINKTIFDEYLLCINKAKELLPLWRVLTLDLIGDYHDHLNMINNFLDYCREQNVREPLLIIKMNDITQKQKLNKLVKVMNEFTKTE
jgi:hypothetical protein